MSKKQKQITLNHFTFTKQKEKTNMKDHQNSHKKQHKKSQSNFSHHSLTQKLKEQTERKTHRNKMYNVQFYSNLIKSDPQGDFIDNIHKKWWGNYKLLQAHHGFIQWLFPNSFTSRFNSRSFALTSQQQKVFRINITIAKRYVTSYEMILQFYGMKLKSKVTGQITQQKIINFKQRYHATLITSFHNHMRITRILCSMAMIGFGRYAKQLSLFLKQQIHGQKGNLKSLAKYNVDKDWKIYQNYVQNQQDLNVFLKQMDAKSHHDKQLNLNKHKQQNIKNFGENVEKNESVQQKVKAINNNVIDLQIQQNHDVQHKKQKKN